MHLPEKALAFVCLPCRFVLAVGMAVLVRLLLAAGSLRRRRRGL